MNRDLVLYRFFGAGGELLYVGQSISVWKRLSGHRQRSEFFHQAVGATFERGFATKDELLAAERQAIATEKPIYNVKRFLDPAAPQVVPDDFWTQVDVSSGATGCWTWKGSSSTVTVGGRSVAPKRAAYLALMGPLEKSQQLRMTCGVSGCINPRHMIAKTKGVSL